MPETTTQTRVCEKNGYLVGPKILLPEDARFFQTAEAKFIVGCNRFRCNLCGNMTRQLAGYRDADEQTASQHAREIYDAPDLANSPFLKPDANSRTYVCACSVVVLTGGQTSPFPNGNWSCAGHPPVDGGAVLPPITQQAANNFVVMVANSDLQKTINLLAITFTNGTGILAMPAQVSLGGGMPRLKIWKKQDDTAPTEIDFTQVASGCVQLTDKTLTAF